MATFSSTLDSDLAVEALVSFILTEDRSAATDISSSDLMTIAGQSSFFSSGEVIEYDYRFVGDQLDDDNNDDFTFTEILLVIDNQLLRITGIELTATQVLNDVQAGGSAQFLASALSGADVLEGNDEPEAFRGFAGNDRIVAGGGDDILDGGEGLDRLFGGGGDDIIAGRSGEDTLKGGGGADDLFGGAQADRLAGGGQDDLMVGGGGDDVLRGGGGADTLIGGGGEDDLRGGAGADLFVFSAASGKDTISRFNATQDVIDLSQIRRITDFEDLVDNHLSQTSDGVQIDVGILEIVEIRSAQITDFSEDNFLF